MPVRNEDVASIPLDATQDADRVAALLADRGLTEQDALSLALALLERSWLPVRARLAILRVVDEHRAAQARTRAVARSAIRPVLPEARADRIALARTRIEAALGPDEQLDTEHGSDFRDDAIAIFAVAVPTFEAGLELTDRVTIELVQRCGFGGLSSTAPKQAVNGDAWRITYRVPVGTVTTQPAVRP